MKKLLIQFSKDVVVKNKYQEKGIPNEGNTSYNMIFAGNPG